MLGELWTTLAFRPGSLLDRFGGRRSVTEIPWESVRTLPLPEIARLALGRMRRERMFEDRLFHWVRDQFESDLIRRALPACDAIYAYETQCERVFEAAAARGVATLLDLPSPEADYVFGLLQAEQRKFPEFEETEPSALVGLQAGRTRRRLRECQLSTIIFANSAFTKRSWVAAGVEESKIHVLPLGAPAPAPGAAESRREGALRFIWAGTFGIRKGAHYLVDAWRRLEAGARAELHVFGSQRLPDRMIAGLPPNLVIHGPVPQRELFEEYTRADLLVFPTLCDGFGLVVTEAMAHGVPVLTTTQAGAADFVTHGESGLIVSPADAADLTDKLAWCLSHPDELRAMRPAAIAAVANWQWPHYRARLREIAGSRLPVAA